MLEISQHRENPQIAEGNPFNVRVVTHIKKTVKKQTRQILSVYVCDPIAWHLSLCSMADDANTECVSVDACGNRIKTEIDEKFIRMHFPSEFIPYNFPRWLITTEIINVEICSDATEISYVCVRASCRHSTSVFVLLLLLLCLCCLLSNICEIYFSKASNGKTASAHSLDLPPLKRHRST